MQTAKTFSLEIEKVAKENSDKEIASLKDQIAMLKTKLENLDNKILPKLSIK